MHDPKPKEFGSSSPLITQNIQSLNHGRQTFKSNYCNEKVEGGGRCVFVPMRVQYYQVLCTAATATLHSKYAIRYQSCQNSRTK